MTSRGRGGRPSKGARDHLVSRPPEAVGARVRQRAREQGYEYVSDYIAAVLAEHEGMPELAPQPRKPRTQEALEIPA